MVSGNGVDHLEMNYLPLLTASFKYVNGMQETVIENRPIIMKRNAAPHQTLLTAVMRHHGAQRSKRRGRGI